MVEGNWFLKFLRNAGHYLTTRNPPITNVELISGYFDCLLEFGELGRKKKNPKPNKTLRVPAEMPQGRSSSGLRFFRGSYSPLLWGSGRSRGMRSSKEPGRLPWLFCSSQTFSVRKSPSTGAHSRVLIASVSSLLPTTFQ